MIVQANTRNMMAADGMVAGIANNWVPSGDSRVIASTRLLAPESTSEMRFMAPAPGEYQFVCTFPSRNLTMFGSFIVLESATEVEPLRKP